MVTDSVSESETSRKRWNNRASHLGRPFVPCRNPSLRDCLDFLQALITLFFPIANISAIRAKSAWPPKPPHDTFVNVTIFSQPRITKFVDSLRKVPEGESIEQLKLNDYLQPWGFTIYRTYYLGMDPELMSNGTSCYRTSPLVSSIDSKRVENQMKTLP